MIFLKKFSKISQFSKITPLTFPIVLRCLFFQMVPCGCVRDLQEPGLGPVGSSLHLVSIIGSVSTSG